MIMGRPVSTPCSLSLTGVAISFRNDPAVSLPGKKIPEFSIEGRLMRFSVILSCINQEYSTRLPGETLIVHNFIIHRNKNGYNIIIINE